MINLTDEEKTLIIEEAIRRDLGSVSNEYDYASVGRKLLMVDELLQGALVCYERDVSCIANIIFNSNVLAGMLKDFLRNNS